MEHNKKTTDIQSDADESRVQLIPAYEEPALFEIRKNEVQIILTDMFLKLRKKGRPKKEDGEESYAA